jgi:Uma2 family endonuclease
MSTADVQTRHTAEDLLTMPDAVSYELVDGELLERNMGAVSSWVAAQLIELLNAHVRQQRAGWVLSTDGSYQCFGDDQDRVRKPDVSFICRGRLPDEALPQGHVQLAPDLAVEVVSPNDRYLEVQAKVAEYLAAGVRLVWVIDPDNRTVIVRALGADQPMELHDGDELTGSDVLPEFRCPVAGLFQSPVE